MASRTGTGLGQSQASKRIQRREGEHVHQSFTVYSWCACEQLLTNVLCVVTEMQQTCLEYHSRSQGKLIKIYMRSLPVFIPWYILSLQSNRREQAYKSEVPSSLNTLDQSSLSANALRMSAREWGDWHVENLLKRTAHQRHLFEQVFVEENSYRGNVEVDLNFKLGLLVGVFFSCES